MQRVTRSTAVAVAPLPPASPGTPGHFAKPDPVAGVPATVPGYEWYEGMQEAVALAIEDSGIVLDASGHDQLRKHIRRLSGGNVTALTVNTVLTADHAGVLPIAIAAARTFTLPAANSANGRPIRFTFVRTDTTAFVATVQRAGADTIEGLTSITVPVGGRIILASDGVSAWRIVARVAAGGMQVFTTSGTFTVPAGVTQVKARVWGGGGAGAGSSVGSAAGGGAGGGYAEGYFAVTPGAAIPVTVAAAVPGANGGVAGGNGGSSSFGSLATATGGNGGTTSGGQATVGTGTGGALNISGGVGIGPVGGQGGPGGGAGLAGSIGYAPSAAGTAGSFPGGGGSGAGNNAGAWGGGGGGAGLVIVEWI